MISFMKYHIITFGCQFNKSDAEKVEKVLKDLDYYSTENLDQADVVLVLACSVRQSAIDRIFGLKKRFEEIKKKRSLITVLSGCVLKSDMPKMRKIFDIIFDITDLSKLPKLLKESSWQAGKLASYFNLHPSYKSNFQAYVPIMTGCNNFCAYCVVPYVRGKEVSRPASQIIDECQKLIKIGYKEITLLGQNVNSYQDTSNKVQGTINFPKLLKEIDQMPGNYWLRFVTSHPKDLSDKLIEVMSNGKHITSYLHLPIQAGDNAVLKKMNRQYTVAHYKKLIKQVREKVLNVAISTDVIVGFPGETKKQFLNTVKVFKEIKFDMAYIAQYSERAGTAAAKLKDDVPKLEKKRREKVLTEILKQTALENNKKYIGQEVKVLVERKLSRSGESCSPQPKAQPRQSEAGRARLSARRNDISNIYLSKTNTFKTVKFSSNKNLIGKFVKVKIKKVLPWGLTGD